MVQVLFIRHAKSDWQHSGLEDQLRPLNARGYESIAIMAKRQILREHLPTKILCSPAVRTYSTALGLCVRLGLSVSLIEICDSLYGQSVKTVAELINANLDDSGVVWVIGHNPTLEILISHWLPSRNIVLPTLGCALLSKTEPEEPWQLQDIDNPKQKF
jgi:phosphohistidine phosphatase